jgi:hypothetical protein
VESRGIGKLAKYWGEWFSSLGDGEMKETNLNIFYHFGASVNFLADKIEAGAPASSILSYLFLTREWLEAFLRETTDYWRDLKDTRHTALHLLNNLNGIEESLRRDWNHLVTELEAQTVFTGKTEIERNLERECKNLSVFTVTRKGIYDTRALIESPEDKFPEKLHSIFPTQMLYDLKQAGRCLAFDIPTACAFHIFRATEALMLAYYALLAKHDWNFKKKDWKIYIEQLIIEKAPVQITDRLEEIRLKDRNPYIHPDQNVTLDEAPLLFELCTGVLHSMAQEMSRLV